MQSRGQKLQAAIRKHWLPLALGLLGFVLLALLAISTLHRFQSQTPIARIEPEVEEDKEPFPSRLERYQQEMEAVKRQHVQRQRSLETIVSMDFGSMSRSADAPRPEKVAEPPVQSTAVAQVQNIPTIEPAVDAIPKPSSVHSRRQGVKNHLPQKKVEVPADPFYTVRVFQPEAQTPTGQRLMYRAVVHGDQHLEPNGSLSLRLLEEMTLGEHQFPLNTLLYGKLRGSSGGRLKVQIYSIGPVPVRLTVYDQDYQEGILYAQEEPLPAALAESRDDALDQLLYSVPYGGVANGLAGLGRNILRRNRRVKPLFLADGYPIFISLEP